MFVYDLLCACLSFIDTQKSHDRPPRSVFQAFCRSHRAAQVNHIRVRARFVWRLQAQAKQMPFLAPFSYSFPDMRAKTRSFRHDRASHPSSLRFYVFLSRACARHPHKRSPTRPYDRYASDHRTEPLRLVCRVIKIIVNIAVCRGKSHHASNSIRNIRNATRRPIAQTSCVYAFMRTLPAYRSDAR